MYKIKSFSIKKWNNNGVEAIKYDGKILINENHLETTLCFKNSASNKNQFYSDELKKYVKYNILKIFNPVENLLQKNQQFI